MLMLQLNDCRQNQVLKRGQTATQIQQQGRVVANRKRQSEHNATKHQSDENELVSILVQVFPEELPIDFVSQKDHIVGNADDLQEDEYALQQHNRADIVQIHDERVEVAIACIDEAAGRYENDDVVNENVASVHLNDVLGLEFLVPCNRFDHREEIAAVQRKHHDSEALYHAEAEADLLVVLVLCVLKPVQNVQGNGQEVEDSLFHV